MALVINDRVKETSTTTGTGTFSLAGAATGFETFVAGIATGNTTYYAIFNQGTTEWEVGLGTVTDATPDTLSRTTIYSSSNSDSAVDFAGGTKDVFCTLPASKAVFGKQEGTDFTGSLLVGHSTTGTLDAATYNTGVGLTALDALTSGDYNSAVGYNAMTACTEGIGNTAMGQYSLLALNTGNYNTGFGYLTGRYITSSIQSTAVGHRAFQVGNGSYNTGIGSYAGGGNSMSGAYNTCVGYYSGQAITSGDANVTLGSVDVASATGDNQLAIGTYDGSTTTTWITGESTGNVEINEVWNPSLSTTGKALVMGF